MKVVRTIFTLVAMFYAVMAVISAGFMAGKGLADAIVRAVVFLCLAVSAEWFENAEQDRKRELEILTEIRDALKLRNITDKVE